MLSTVALFFSGLQPIKNSHILRIHILIKIVIYLSEKITPCKHKNHLSMVFLKIADVYNSENGRLIRLKTILCSLHIMAFFWGGAARLVLLILFFSLRFVPIPPLYYHYR